MVDDRDDSDREARDLDNTTDRDELRRRYYGLLQELRVLLPGVQVLAAFLLTAPFAPRFVDLDDAGRTAYLVALVTAVASIIMLMTPTVFHRVADRRARAARLEWGIRLTLAGVVLLATSLTSSLWCITRLVFGSTAAAVIAVAVVATFASMWLVLPLAAGRPGATSRRVDR